MKHKIKLDIHSMGEHTEYIIKAIAAHNSGLRTITPLDLETYLRVRDAIFPNSANDLAHVNSDKDWIVRISRDKGKTYSLTLEWIEVHELKDDIPNELFTTNLYELSDLEKEIINELENK